MSKIPLIGLAQPGQDKSIPVAPDSQCKYYPDDKRSSKILSNMKSHVIGFLRFLYGRLRDGHRETIKDTLWLLFWVVFFVLIFRIHPPTIPPFEHLSIEQGALHFVKRNGKFVRGAMPIVNGKEFGWSGVWFGPDGFPYGKEWQEKMEGRPAKVWWYKQKTHLWYSYPVVAQVEVSGVPIKTYDQTVKAEWSSYRFGFVFYPIMMSLMLLVYVGRYCWRYIQQYRQLAG